MFRGRGPMGFGQLGRFSILVAKQFKLSILATDWWGEMMSKSNKGDRVLKVVPCIQKDFFVNYRN